MIFFLNKKIKRQQQWDSSFLLSSVSDFSFLSQYDSSPPGYTRSPKFGNSSKLQRTISLKGKSFHKSTSTIVWEKWLSKESYTQRMFWAFLVKSKSSLKLFFSWLYFMTAVLYQWTECSFAISTVSQRPGKRECFHYHYSPCNLASAVTHSLLPQLH